MIQVTIEPNQLLVNQSNELVIRLTNTGRGPCTNVVFKILLPVQIILLHGSDRIQIDRLDPGQTAKYSLDVKPKLAGVWPITSANFSYRDPVGQPRRISDLYLELLASAETPAETNPDLELAEMHEAAGRWQLAWPLFRRAGLQERSRQSFNRAIDLYLRERLDHETAQQYEAWADLEKDMSGRHGLGDRAIAESFETASKYYVLSNAFESAVKCREKAAQVMEMPRFQLQITTPVGDRFTSSQSTLIIVKVTNVGYGPAREVRVRLAGDIQQPYPEHVFTELHVNQTQVWDTAPVVPVHAGKVRLRVEVDFKSYRTEQTGHVEIEHPLLVDSGDLDGFVSRTVRGSAGLELKIEKYLAPGAINNEVDICDSAVIARGSLFSESDLKSIKDSVVIGNRQDRIGIEQQMDANGNPASLCSNCGAQRVPDGTFCSKCGVKLI